MVRRTKEEAQETRNQILDAAERAFHERGVARTTLADIAAMAGVTRGAIYWHFNNKAELLHEMLETLGEPLEELARVSDNEDEIDPLGCMRRLLVKVFQQIASDPRTRRLNEIVFHKCEFTNDIADFRIQREAANSDCNVRLAKAFTHAVKKGQLPEDLDAPRAAIAHHAYVEGIIRQWLLAPESFDIYKDAERLTEASFDMLRWSPALRK